MKLNRQKNKRYELKKTKTYRPNKDKGLLVGKGYFVIVTCQQTTSVSYIIVEVGQSSVHLFWLQKYDLIKGRTDGRRDGRTDAKTDRRWYEPTAM